MTVSEAAKKLSRTHDAVLKMIKRGDLAAKKFGKAWDVSPASVAKYQRIIAGRAERTAARLAKQGALK